MCAHEWGSLNVVVANMEPWLERASEYGIMIPVLGLFVLSRGICTRVEEQLRWTATRSWACHGDPGTGFPSVVMLSILRRQAVILEKELVEARQQMEVLKRRQAEHDAVLKAKEERISELEDELSRRRPLNERVLCIACGGTRGEVEGEEDAEGPTEEPKEEPKVDVDEVLQRLEQLKKKLLSTESRLTSAELEKALLELQLETRTSKIKRELTRELETVRKTAREALTSFAKAKHRADEAEKALGASKDECVCRRPHSAPQHGPVTTAVPRALPLQLLRSRVDASIALLRPSLALPRHFCHLQCPSLAPQARDNAGGAGRAA